MVRRLLLQLSRADGSPLRKGCGLLWRILSLDQGFDNGLICYDDDASAGWTGSIRRHIRAVSVGTKVRPEHASDQHGK